MYVFLIMMAARIGRAAPRHDVAQDRRAAQIYRLKRVVGSGVIGNSELLVRFVTKDAPGFQLIVTEHANLRDDWFQAALVERPRTKPPALVPDDWPDGPSALQEHQARQANTLQNCLRIRLLPKQC